MTPHGYAELIVGAGEGGGEFLQLLAADIETRLADGALGELQEGLAEDALGAVTRKHFRIDLSAYQRLFDGSGRNALGSGLSLHALEKCAEIATAGNLLWIVRRSHRRRGEGGAAWREATKRRQKQCCATEKWAWEFPR